jgi:type 1 glutamine amidotransferase
MLAGAPGGRAEAEKPLRVLLTYGGHGFQQKEFFAMWDEFPGVTWSKAELPKDADLLKPGLEKEVDVTRLLETGIGVVSTHHNLGAHRDWPEFCKIIGGKYVFKPFSVDGKEYGKSNYAHDQDLEVTVADKEHPITKGLAGFTIHDEAYGRFYVAPDSHVLLTTDHPKCGRDVAWTRQYGKSRVCYLVFGHDSKAWANPAYRDLLGRAIRWAAER